MQTDSTTMKHTDRAPHGVLLQLYGKYIERFVHAAVEDSSTETKQQLPLSFPDWRDEEFNNQWGEYAGYTQIEYDLSYYGGDYSNVGQFALVPRWLIQFYLEAEYSEPEHRAFQECTGHDPKHIIHFTPDEVYNAEGKLILMQ